MAAVVVVMVGIPLGWLFACQPVSIYYGMTGGCQSVFFTNRPVGKIYCWCDCWQNGRTADSAGG